MTDMSSFTGQPTNRAPLAFDDRTRRVFELRELIREGKYQPDAGQIAGAIVAAWSAAAAIQPEPALEGGFGRFIVPPSAPANNASGGIVARSA